MEHGDEQQAAQAALQAELEAHRRRVQAQLADEAPQRQQLVAAVAALLPKEVAPGLQMLAHHVRTWATQDLLGRPLDLQRLLPRTAQRHLRQSCPGLSPAHWLERFALPLLQLAHQPAVWERMLYRYALSPTRWGRIVHQLLFCPELLRHVLRPRHALVGLHFPGAKGCHTVRWCKAEYGLCLRFVALTTHAPFHFRVEAWTCQGDRGHRH